MIWKIVKKEFQLNLMTFKFSLVTLPCIVLLGGIAVGQTIKVAPAAELYYIAQWTWHKRTGTLRSLAQYIRRMPEVNEQLPKYKKVRVTSISRCWTRPYKDDKAIIEAVRKVRAAGMLVVCSGIEKFYSNSGLACYTFIYISWMQASPSSSKTLFTVGPIKNNVIPIIAEASHLLLWENHKRLTTSCIKGFLLKCVIHDTLWETCETINSEVKVTMINSFGSQHYPLKQVTVFHLVCSSFGTLFANLYDCRRRSGIKN